MLKFIPILEALKITGHTSTHAFYMWCRRYAARYPEGPQLLRRNGFVEEGSLEAALIYESRSIHEKKRHAITTLTSMGLMPQKRASKTGLEVKPK